MGYLSFRFLTEDIQISPRRFTAVTFITAGILSWLFLIVAYFDSIFTSLTGDPFWGNIGEPMFFGFGAFFAIIGSMISEKVDRRKLLWSWITIGILATVSLAVFQGIIFSLLSTVFLGISLGLGFPSCAALLADCTAVEERARVAGTIILETFIMVSLALIGINLLNLGLIGVILFLAILRGTSYLALGLDFCTKIKEKPKSWRFIFSHRDFVFYLLPWMMFNAASGLVAFAFMGLPQTPDYQWALTIGSPLRFLGTAIFGLASGVVADRFGRKQPIIIGLILLGVGFAFLGLATSPLSVLVYQMFSGIAWGGLMAVYLAVLGDLAFPGSKEKFYALGAVTPLIIYMSLASIPELSGVSAPANFISPILSIILFLSIVPILYASETLPESKMRERRFRKHIREVGKIVSESKAD